MGEFEAIGDAVTGGLISRAVEPGAGEAGGQADETRCLNCGAPLAGPYCHACGQKAHVHRSLRGFGHDLLHGVLHFEGKVWKTLPMLLWRPGELTRRYIEGERARFVSPIALFLFSVFLMYAAVTLLGGTRGLLEEAKAGLQQELQVNQAKLENLEGLRTDAAKAGQPTAELDERIADVKDEMRKIERVRDGDQAQPIVNESDNVPGWLGSWVDKASENPELVVYKLKTNAYKFSWMIIPLSVPFVWLLFPFNRAYHLYDHTVFVTYSLCFMSLLVVTGLLLGATGATSLAGLLWLIPPFHIYRQLKGAYSLRRAQALWRTVLLTLFAMMVVGLFSAILLGVGTYA